MDELTLLHSYEKELHGLKAQISTLVEVAQDLIDFEDTALIDDHVPFELIEKAKQAIAQVGE